jgi:hypothetical protein
MNDNTTAIECQENCMLLYGKNDRMKISFCITPGSATNLISHYLLILLIVQPGSAGW